MSFSHPIYVKDAFDWKILLELHSNWMGHEKYSKKKAKNR